MPNYEHTNLIKGIARLDNVPEDPAEYAAWIKADGHLDLLRDNAKEDELIIYGCGDHTFINAVVVREKNISPLDKGDLLGWSGNPFDVWVCYTYCEGTVEDWIERNNNTWGCKTLDGAQQLVFGRTFEGRTGKGGSNLEILQEYVHVTEMYWCPERNAYCRFDENGDFDPIVSITQNRDRGDETLVSFKREPLELYLAATNSVLVRMFVFTLYNRNFHAWPDGPEKVINVSDDFFYRQRVNPGKAGYTRGVQIIRPSRPKAEIFSSLETGWSGEKEREYVEFLAYDSRNKRIANISTDPAATTKYIEAQNNSLPYELSPVFFRPDVLLKYKADSDKYTVKPNNIYCRGAWRLRDYVFNEAGQVQVYICDLQNLPYREQLYWKSHNEKPKPGISEWAFSNHLRDDGVNPDSLVEVLSIARMWNEFEVTWWKIREEALVERVHTPRTSSRIEWANAFMDLSKLINEGFMVTAIRKGLEELNIAFDKGDKSIALLEKFLHGQGMINDGQKLVGLKTVQHIRSTFAHSSGHKAHDLANNALEKHGTFSAHYESVCETVAPELKLIEEAFNASPPAGS